MIDLNKPEKIISGLLENFNGNDILPDLRVHDVYTGNFLEAATNSGILGILPIGGTSTGDILALVPVIDKQLIDWPVLKFSHMGGDTSLISTSLTLLPVFAIVEEIRPRYILEDKAIIIKSKQNLLLLNKFLGNDNRTIQCIDFLENLNNKDISFDEFSLYKKFLSPCWLTDFLETYKSIYMHDQDIITNWKNFIKQHPFVVPAWQMLFKAEAKMELDAFDSAWKSVTSEYYFNNYIFKLAKTASMGVSGIDTHESKNYEYLCNDDPRVEAARYIVASGKGKDHPLYPAIETEANEEPDANAWLTAGNNLLENKSYWEAYCAYINAGYWYYLENEALSQEAASGALNSARALKHPILPFLLESIQAAK